MVAEAVDDFRLFSLFAAVEVVVVVVVLVVLVVDEAGERCLDDFRLFSGLADLTALVFLLLGKAVFFSCSFGLRRFNANFCNTIAFR